MNIGSRLKEIRKSKGLTGKDLEHLSGVKQSTISRIEKNLHSPSLETLSNICKALDISLSDLLADPDSQLPPDLLQLIETAKKLTPEERKKFNELLQTILERTDRNER